MADLTDTCPGAVGKSAAAAKADGGAIDSGINHHAVGGTVGIMTIGTCAAGAGSAVRFHVECLCCYSGGISVAKVTFGVDRTGQAAEKALVIARSATDVRAAVVMAGGTRLGDAGFAVAAYCCRSLVGCGYAANNGKFAAGGAMAAFATDPSGSPVGRLPVAGGTGTSGQINYFIDVRGCGVQMADCAAVDAVAGQSWSVSRIKVSIVTVAGNYPAGCSRKCSMTASACAACFVCP